MILQSLVRYYEKLATQGKVETSGWNNVQVSARIVLDVDGKLKGLVSTKVTEMRGKRTIEVSASMSVPEQPTKSSGIKAYFLCDSVPYLFGINAKKTSQQDDTEEKKRRKRQSVQKNALLPLARCIIGFLMAALLQLQRLYFDFSIPGT